MYLPKDYGHLPINLNEIVPSYGGRGEACAYYIRNEEDFKEILEKKKKSLDLSSSYPFSGITKFEGEDYYIFEEYSKTVKTYGDFDEYTGSYLEGHIHITKKSIIEDIYNKFISQFTEFIPRDNGYIGYVYDYKKDQEEALLKYGVNPKNIIMEKCMHFWGDKNSTHEKLNDFLNCKDEDRESIIIIGNLNGLGDIEGFKTYYQKLIQEKVGLIIVDNEASDKMHRLSTVDNNKEMKGEEELAKLLFEVINMKDFNI